MSQVDLEKGGNSINIKIIIKGVLKYQKEHGKKQKCRQIHLHFLLVSKLS
jgi:hypothetical protein